MDVTIEKGIKMPSSGKDGKYPWDDMEIGDSFFIRTKNAYSAAYYTNRRLAPKVFQCRKWGEGYRIWRVK